jgi:hypothetical protein
LPAAVRRTLEYFDQHKKRIEQSVQRSSTLKALMKKHQIEWQSLQPQETDREARGGCG